MVTPRPKPGSSQVDYQRQLDNGYYTQFLKSCAQRAVPTFDWWIIIAFWFLYWLLPDWFNLVIVASTIFSLRTSFLQKLFRLSLFFQKSWQPLAKYSQHFSPRSLCGQATCLRLLTYFLMTKRNIKMEILLWCDSAESQAVGFLHWQWKIPLRGFFFWANVRNRTGDLRLTMALLYQLSYIGKWGKIWKLVCIFAPNVANERFLLHGQCSLRAWAEYQIINWK